MIKEFMGKDYKLYFNEIAVVPEENIGYGSAIAFNGLFEIQMDTEECTYLTGFPNEGMFQTEIHFSAVYCEGRVFFFPQRGLYISVYTLDSGMFSQIEIPDCDYTHYYKHIKIGQAFSYGKKVYAIGASYPYVIVIDADTLSVRYIPIGADEREIMFRAGGCFAARRFFIPSTVSGMILSVDLTDDTVELHFPAPDYKGAWAMAYDGEKFWIAPFREDAVVCAWDPRSGEVWEYAGFPKGYRPGKNPFHRCFFWNGKIWMWPWTANMILEVDSANGELREASCGIDFSEEMLTGCFFIKDAKLFLKQKAKKEHTWYDQEGEDYVFDLRKWKLEKRSFIFSQGKHLFIRTISNSVKEWLKKRMGESRYFSLEDYIILLQTGDEEIIAPIKEGKNNQGTVIYRCLLKMRVGD